VNAAGEFVIDGLLLANIIDSELSIGDTSTISGLRVGLALLISVALCRSSSHFSFY
jgi:hypothetical protein